MTLYCRKQDPVLPDYPTSGDHAREAGTIHFQFSHHQHAAERRVEGSTASSVQGEVVGGAGGLMVLEGGSVSEYKGPECYIKPKSKSNLKIIRNAICSVCLAGEVNMSLKQKTLAVSQ